MSQYSGRHRIMGRRVTALVMTVLEVGKRILDLRVGIGSRVGIKESC